MAPLKIKKLPDAVLRKKARKVEKVTVADRETLSAMAETMYLNEGVGLAALQVGIDKQFAVVDVGDGLIKLVNPIIMKREGAEEREEGCLSVPGLSVNIRRSKKVIVSYMTEAGEVVQLKADGLLARALQHEIDHLNGRLIVDYINPIKRLFLKTKHLDKMKFV